MQSSDNLLLFTTPIPHWVDQTLKSGRVSNLSNVKLSNFTYFSWIYSGLMSDSSKW